LKTQLNRSNIVLWILLLIYRLVHVGMMLFLASLIAFHVFVVLFLVIVPCQLLSVRSYFGNIGFASLVCLQRLLVTGMHDLRVGFGRSYVDCWSVGLHLVQLITLRLMG
jgi:hypothetical protein